MGPNTSEGKTEGVRKGGEIENPIFVRPFLLRIPEAGRAFIENLRKEVTVCR